MKLPPWHPRTRRTLALGVLLAPPLLWCAVLAVLPTEYARRTIVARLEAACGRAVHLGGLRVGWLGTVSLDDLRIGAPDSRDDPWLTVRHTAIDVNLWQLLLGHVDPREVRVDGLSLRVLRRADGSLELGDLVAAPPEPDGARSTEECEHDFLVRIRDSHVTVVDEPTRTRLRLTDVEGQATRKGGVASLTELTGDLNGGRFALAAQIDRSERVPSFEGQLRLRDVALDEGMNALGYVLPVLAGTGARVDGVLSLDLYARGRGDTAEALRKSLVGRGTVCVDPAVLDGSRLLEGIGPLVEVPRDGRTGSVRSNVTFRDGRISTDGLTIDVGRVPVVLSGWTDFDGRLDYRLRADDLAGRLPARARELLSEFAGELDDVADVRISGTVDALEVTLDGVALGRAPSGPRAPGRADDRERLREVGRKILDRVRR